MMVKPIFETIKEIKKNIENLSCDDLEKEMQNPETLVVDIREMQERVDSGAIPDSIHAPRGMLEFWADPKSPYYRKQFKPDKRVVLYCAGGARSALATKALLDMGYQSVAHLDPGFIGWKKEKRPVEEMASKSRWIRRIMK
ncbi:MAG: rhodanese-like domain-containing protein [Gammaproteobacteria bacterium]|nr:rhodanese-like domain-containing protein [Gammaproteobacteria bacterium]